MDAFPYNKNYQGLAMKPTHFIMLALLLTVNVCWAYGGGGGGTKACSKPKFGNFTPDPKTEAQAGSEFSFMASKNTYPNTIKVALKGQPVELKVTDKNEAGFLVSGVVPQNLKGSFARVAISAESQGNCPGSDGWLLKIAP